MLEKESSQGPFSISPEIAAISYMDANTLIFSNTVPEIAAVSSMGNIGYDWVPLGTIDKADKKANLSPAKLS